MITVRIGRHRNEISLVLKGHAGYAEAGKDIVCAAASMLFCLCCERADALAADVSYVRGSGYGDLVCTADDMEAVTAFETLFRGFELLAEQYPEHVKVEGKTEICPF